LLLLSGCGRPPCSEGELLHGLEVDEPECGFKRANCPAPLPALCPARLPARRRSGTSASYIATLHVLLHEWASARALAEQTIRLAERAGLAVMPTLARLCLVWCDVRDGRGEPTVAAAAAQVNIFKVGARGQCEIVAENLDECTVCDLCLKAALAGAVTVGKLCEA
jgi:hypothetical protein